MVSIESFSWIYFRYTWCSIWIISSIQHICGIPLYWRVQLQNASTFSSSADSLNKHDRQTKDHCTKPTTVSQELILPYNSIFSLPILQDGNAQITIHRSGELWVVDYEYIGGIWFRYIWTSLKNLCYVTDTRTFIDYHSFLFINLNKIAWENVMILWTRRKLTTKHLSIDQNWKLSGKVHELHLNWCL